jgi:hypothetical protein
VVAKLQSLAANLELLRDHVLGEFMGVNSVALNAAVSQNLNLLVQKGPVIICQ